MFTHTQSYNNTCTYSSAAEDEWPFVRSLDGDTKLVPMVSDFAMASNTGEFYNVQRDNVKSFIKTQNIMEWPTVESHLISFKAWRSNGLLQTYPDESTYHKHQTNNKKKGDRSGKKCFLIQTKLTYNDKKSLNRNF